MKTPIMSVAYFEKLTKSRDISMTHLNDEYVMVNYMNHKTRYKLCKLLADFLKELKNSSYVNYRSYSKYMEDAYYKELETLVRKEAINEILKDLQ